MIRALFRRKKRIGALLLLSSVLLLSACEKPVERETEATKESIVLESSREESREEPTEPTASAEPEENRQIDFAVLQQRNPEVYAWIYIPDTGIDYPILQHQGEDDYYYLDYDLDGNPSADGCIYTEKISGKDFRDNHTVIYGHRTLDNTMFTPLHLFEDSEFFDAHPYFYIYTPEKTLRYEIFRAYEYTDEHLLRSYNPVTELNYSVYLDHMKGYRTLVNNERPELLEALDYQQKICTLSTGVQGKDQNRYLVQGVLLDE